MSEKVTKTELKAKFQEYAGRKGDKDTINMRELRKFICKELGDILEKPRNKEAKKAIFSKCDANSDGEIDQKEFEAWIDTLDVLD